MTPSILSDVNALTDDEDAPPVVATPDPGPTQSIEAVAKRRPAKRKQVTIVQPVVDGRALRHRVEGPCGCRCQCFAPFRTSDTFDQLHKVQKELIGLEKLEQDNYALSL